jgi:NADPH-dependent 2,4-dienoyl-CoA reductase/sulfur reductase-like enzyme
MIDEREIVVIGGGPAGMSACIEARRAGARVALIEERPTLGGQIYKQPPHGFHVRQPRAMGKEYLVAAPLLDETWSCGAEILTGHVAWGVWRGSGTQAGFEVSLYSEEDKSERTIRTQALIVAAGAYDRPVAFPGWTLPGVLTAGGAQALVKIQKVSPGRRILMAGSGPLALAFAVQLERMGAHIVAVLEAAPAPDVRAIARLLSAGLAGNASLLWEGISYLAYLHRRRIPLLYGWAISRAVGTREVEQAVAVRVDTNWRPVRGTERRFDVDTVCLGYGFFPSIEIARTLGCRAVYDEQLGGHVPWRDADLRGSVVGTYFAGDGAGVNGSAMALNEGRLAGVAACRDIGLLPMKVAHKRLRLIRRRLRRLQHFRHALGLTYPVGPGIYEWATPETIVCRCEDVTLAEVEANILPGSRDPNAVRALTRASMGMCQGRTCARQIASIVARATGQSVMSGATLSPRPPLKPVPIGLIANTTAAMPVAIERAPGT